MMATHGTKGKIMKLLHLFGASAAMAAALAIPPAAYAQQTTSDIRGVVVDEAGAPLSNATITVVDTRTNQSRTLTTGRPRSLIISSFLLAARPI